MNAPAGGRIDVHHHALPADLVETMRELGLPTPARQWTPTETLDMMDAHGIAAAVISNIVPCDLVGSARAAHRLARQANEAAAEAARARPDRFGFFALLPLPHVDLALDEATYALDDLSADGVALVPHGGERYLGADVFEPLFAELDRRRAVVFVHPMDLPGGGVRDVPAVFADYLLDTTRGAVSLITSGTLQRHPGMPVVLSHAGGFLPYAADRIEAAATLTAGVARETVRECIQNLYYDLALCVPSALPSLLAAADPGRILYGTDWSGVPQSEVRRAIRALDEAASLDEQTRRAINRDNALRLLPRLAGRLNAAPIPAAVP
jgi:predicted TIM-barrel fold metal-dependent hydrolase